MSNEKLGIDYLKQNYLEYAVSVLKDRAIPYLSDGLKPVQRRVLYSMYKMRNLSSDKYKKSARIVGDVIGKYHPHGDLAVYEAIVRLSQWWSVRYPLIDGQGNFGSPDGDSAAAMRYTEVRLTKFAEEILLRNLSPEILTYRPNYDGAEFEPFDLDSVINLSLINGAVGIGVALSTDIPSHNIVELNEATKMYIDNNDVTLDEMMTVLQGPDYPKGGQIVDSREKIKDIYEKGYGVLRVRARWKVEKLARGDWRVIIYELPPYMTTLKVLERVDSIVNPKLKNGKISAKDAAERSALQAVMSGCKDYSDKNTPIQIVIEPKSKRQKPEELMAYLIPKLGLEERVRVNLTMVGIDGTPKCRNFKDIIVDWTKSRFNFMTKRVNARLNAVNDRIKILNGRIIAFDNIDKVISIIQNADDPKSELISQIGVDEVQAEDILEIKLRQLARLEKVKLENEISTLEKEAKTLKGLLGSDKKMYTLMKKEMDEVTEMFKDDRRTLIKEEEVLTLSNESNVQEEDIVVIYTKQGWITSRKGHDFDVDGIQLKIDDEIQFIGKGSTVNNCCFLGTDGRAYSVKGSDIPDGKTGWVHLNTLIQTDGTVDMRYMIFPDNAIDLLVYNDEGYGYVSNSHNLYSKNRAGKNFMTLPSEKSNVQKPLVLGASNRVAIQTTDDRVLVYDLAEINKLDRGKGVKLVNLVDGNLIKSVVLLENDELNVLLDNGKTKTIKGDDFTHYVGKRAQRGKVLKDGIIQ